MPIQESATSRCSEPTRPPWPSHRRGSANSRSFPGTAYPCFGRHYLHEATFVKRARHGICPLLPAVRSLSISARLLGRASTARSQNNGSTAKCVVQLCRRLDARRPTKSHDHDGQVGPGGGGTRPRRSGGCAISLPWIRRGELLWLVPEDWARHGSGFVAIGLLLLPRAPSRAMSCRCLSPDLWLPGCAADRGYPVLDVFCPARGLNVGHGQSSTKRGGLDPVVRATANRHRTHARLRGLSGRGTMRTFL